MTKIILLVFAVSWDSFVAGIGDGLLGMSGASPVKMAALFALSDGAATAIGLRAGALWLNSNLISTLSAACWLLLVLAVVQRSLKPPARARAWPYLLPLVFSLDNLFATPAFAHTGVAPVLSVGSTAAASGLLFFSGRILAWWAKTQLTDPIRRSSTCGRILACMPELLPNRAAQSR